MAVEQRDIQALHRKDRGKPPARIFHPMEDIERLFDEFRMGAWPRGLRWGRFGDLPLAFDERAPRLDVIDRDAEVVVRAEVPGFRREDIEISLTGNLLTIRGETRREAKEEKGDYYRCETTQGNFSRTVSLPAEVSEPGARARLKDGLLEVTLPKAEQAKKRAITIE